MSADNYATCPRCWAKQGEEIARAEANLRSSYGVVPPEVFELASAALKKLRASRGNSGESVAEYYELGIIGMGPDNKGVFDVSYHGICRTEGCGFEYTFKYRKDGLK